MTKRREETATVLGRLRVIPLLVVGAACLAWGSPATAEDCGSPCTVTRAGLPTFRLVNTVSGVQDWDLETSAFGVELTVSSNSPTIGAFRVEHGADNNTLVIDDSGRVGIGTTAPVADLQVSAANPELLLDDTSSGAGSALFRLVNNTFGMAGNNGFNVFSFDTRAGAGTAFFINRFGQVGLGTLSPQAQLHVNGGARIEGDVAIASSKTLKTAFSPVSSDEILAVIAELPVATWRYKSEDESARHIGPFAEDFERLFGLGNGETISIVDAQGVVIAAIQGLQERLAATKSELEQKLVERDAEIAELTARLAAVEERLDGRR